ncbi:MAG: hypothetical protein M1812_004919 [Candelaria pacifica]|nr:MAG: hypothetical protein M1812_004919 [Candelaria pacifica]
MPLTVLTDNDVRTLLRSLTKADIAIIQHSLAEALHAYSSGTQDDGCCSMYQPERTSFALKDGSTTLFMPARTSDSTGMKIVTISETCSLKSMSSLSISSRSDSNSTTSSTTTAVDIPPPSIASSQSTTPKGSLTLLDSRGAPRGLINAEELTAFRTALAATLIFSKRKHVSTITVFGAGKQAYWHIRLALILRGPEIKRINIINRTFARAQPLLKEFYSEESTDWRSNTKFSILSTEYGEYARLLKEEVRKADVIFCCTPSLAPLFPAEYLTSHEGSKKGRLISAIGSYKPHMCELHPDILRQAVSPPHSHHHHKHANRGGVIVVDSLDACLKEAGEVIQAGLGPEQLVELGELCIIKKQRMKELEEQGIGDAGGKEGLLEWLTKGNVIYKSVGLGLMDLVVGGDLVMLARERGIGTTIENF